MDVYRRYFKITQGPLIEAVKDANKINKAAQAEYRKILKEIGANSLQYYQISQKLVGIIFDEKPDSGIYKQVKCGGWYPKKNCKAGKELAKRLDAVKTENAKEKALETIGLLTTPHIFTDGMLHMPRMIVIPEDDPIAYIDVPWYDEDPEKLKAYKREREKGTSSDLTYDALLWEPTEDMEPSKEWEVIRHVEEWNEKVQAKTNP